MKIKSLILAFFLLLISFGAWAAGPAIFMLGSGGTAPPSNVTLEYVASASNSTFTVNTTLATSSTLNVAAGDIIVAWASWEDGTSTVSVSDGGSNTLTMENVNNYNNNYGALGYLTAASANSEATFTMTNGTARGFRFFGVLQFRPSAGATIARDTANTGSGTGTSMASGTISTSVDHTIVVGGAKNYTAGAFTTHQIGGVSADGATNIGDLGGIWYKIHTSTASDITASATGANAAWICNVIAIKGT